MQASSFYTYGVRMITQSLNYRTVIYCHICVFNWISV